MNIEQELTKLLVETTGCSNSQDGELTKEVVTDKTSARTNQALQDMFDYIRCTVKYLHFDLEATRRENQYLMKQLKDR